MNWSAQKITTVLVVPTVEVCLDFYVERLGFMKVVDVPHGNSIGFAILVQGSCELMLQSEASVREDLKVAADTPIAGTSAALFIEVDHLSAIIERLGGYPVAVPRRTTFYGMDEIGVRDPAGHLVMFAEKLPES